MHTPPLLMDAQATELLGRNRLMSELLRAGLEVALPARDRGIDLLAYVDLSSKVQTFVAVPIQMKAASRASFSIDRKYAKISNLILAHVWHLNAPEKAITYALRYPQAIAVAEKMGWTQTNSWVNGGYYSTSNPSKRLCALLEEYRMSSTSWWDCVVGTSGISDEL